MKKKYVLTISILASNRKDTLPKTLSSIKPILDNVSSELIIVDTGCDEELLAVIRQYTDKIIKFKWCNDFAKARNTGLEQAQGEWFMFIDDDEWFEDVTEFIQFFNSGEKDAYGFAKYIVRNYTNWEGTLWGESIAGRMFKILDGTKFVDKVHERTINIMGPTKNFTAYAHHYGYLYKTEQDKKAHFERNITLLREQVKEEPHIARHYAHYIQEYCTEKEYEKVIELAYEGIANADMSCGDNKKDVPALYAMIVWSLVNQKKSKEACEKALEYIATENNSDLCRMALYEYMAVAALEDKDYSRLLEYADKYFEYVDYFAKNQEAKYQQGAILIMESDSIENIQRVSVIAFVAASFVGDEKKLEKYMKYLDFSHRFAIPEPDMCMKNIVLMMRNTTRLANGASIIDEILKSPDFKNILLREIMLLKENDLQGYYKLANMMMLTTSTNGYVQYMRIISAREDIYQERLISLYRGVIGCVSDIINMDRDFFDIAINRKIDISSMIEESSLSNWMASVDSFMVNVKVKELIEQKQIFDKVLKREGMHLRYFDMAMMEALFIRKKLDNMSLDTLKSEMQELSDEIISFYKVIYKENVINEHPSVLPTRCKIAILLKELCDKECTNEEFANIRSQIIQLMPRMQKIMDKYEELV